MVAIPEQQDPTLEALRRICAAQGNSEARRNYVGASEIGGDCLRAVWYNYNGYPRQDRPVTTLWSAEDGHRTEDLIASRLRMVEGVNLLTHNEHGEQFGFSVLGGKFKGHVDGIISGLLHAPKRTAIWEHKTKNQKAFDDFKKKKLIHGSKGVLREWSNVYHVQAQIYMHFMQLDRHYMTVASAGGRDIESCWTEYKPEIASMYYDKAEKVINSREPLDRISNKADYFVCKMCSFSDVCHG